MDREKVLAFLNIDLKKDIDRFTMKLFTWFYVGFSVFVFGGGSLLQLIEFSLFDFCALFFCIISIVFLFIRIHFCRKHTEEWFHHLSAVICSCLILFYGWSVFSKGELAEFGYPRFGWIYISALIAALVLGGYMMLKFYMAFKIIMNNTIEDARAILKPQNKMLIPAAVAFSPMLLVGLLEGPFTAMGLGIGFGLWCLMCIWLALALFMLPKIVIIIKYRVYLW